MEGNKGVDDDDAGGDRKIGTIRKVMNRMILMGVLTVDVRYDGGD